MTRITSPFQYRSTALDVVKGHDLRDRIAIVTGGAAGVGLETTRALASAGADVTVAVRDLAKADAAVKALRESTRNDKIHAARLDLASLASVRSFAQEFLARKLPLHILINNAGIMACPLMRTEDGFENQFGTNHLGHFLMTVLLHPALAQGAPARVVSLSSNAHHFSDIVFDDVNYHKRPYDRGESYGQSKTANSLFAVGLTRRWSSQGIYANAVMPGGIMTGLQKFISPEEMRGLGWVDENNKPLEQFKTPEQGASTSTWAAVGTELSGIGGLYLEDNQQAVPWVHPMNGAGVKDYAINPESADRLWTLSATLTGVQA